MQRSAASEGDAKIAVSLKEGQVRREVFSWFDFLISLAVGVGCQCPGKTKGEKRKVESNDERVPTN